MDVAFLLRQLFRLINGLGIAWNWLKIYKLTKVSKKIVDMVLFCFFIFGIEESDVYLSET